MKLFSLFLLLFASITGAAQGPATREFSINGSMAGMGEGLKWVYLSYVDRGNRVTDSSRIKNQEYHFRGKIAEPVLARLWMVKDTLINGKWVAMRLRKLSTELFLEPASILVSHSDSFSNARVSGSAAHEQYMRLQKVVEPFEDQIEEINKAYSGAGKAGDEKLMKMLSARYDSLDLLEREQYMLFFKSNPSSPLAVFALSRYAGWEIDADKVSPLMELLPEVSRKLPSAVELYEKVEKARKTGIGAAAMDFVQNDTLGKPVHLSAFRGHYVLVDFWASWCGPCRAENPNLVKTYQKFKDRGLQIVGISLDQPNGREKWIRAIHDDQLYWTQLSDLRFWKNAVAVQYGIEAIPQNFLIDPDGKIIGKNLRGEALEKKLDELFKMP